MYNNNYNNSTNNSTISILENKELVKPYLQECERRESGIFQISNEIFWGQTVQAYQIRDYFLFKDDEIKWTEHTQSIIDMAIRCDMKTLPGCPEVRNINSNDKNIYEYFELKDLEAFGW